MDGRQQFGFKQELPKWFDENHLGTAVSRAEAMNAIDNDMAMELQKAS